MGKPAAEELVWGELAPCWTARDQHFPRFSSGRKSSAIDDDHYPAPISARPDPLVQGLPEGGSRKKLSPTRPTGQI